MKKKWKRILTVVLAFVIIVGSLPAYAKNGKPQASDSGHSFWLQEYDLSSGKETDTAWYPDESGLIKVPLLDRTTKKNSPLKSYTEYGIALKDVGGLDEWNLYLDFNSIRDGSDYDYSTTKYGTFGISADLKSSLESSLRQQGSAEFKIEYKGSTYTVRLLNENDQGEQPGKVDGTDAVQQVIDLINAIGKVTKDSGDAIKVARAAYDDLNAEEQGKVSNYATLKAAEDAYKNLSAESVIKIYDEKGLRALGADGNYRLMSDIELTAPWTPIESFSGTLDGNGHVISGLQISGAGFFATTAEGAVIRNLGLEGTVNHKSFSPAGAMIGRVNGNTTITGCYTNVAVKADSMEHVGGIAGEVRAACIIENCYSVGTLTGGTNFAYAGGIIGKNGSKETTVRNCYTTAAKAIGYSDTTPGSNNYCKSKDDAYASQISEDADEFLSALNNGGDAYKKGNAGGLGYPVLSWQRTEDSDDKAAVAAVEALIDAIKEVTSESGDAIAAAREAYNALTSGQKAMVSNFEKLTAAEEAYAAFKEEPSSSVKVYYTLPGEEPQEVQAGDTVYISPKYAKGQVKLYYEGIPAEESSMAGMRFGDSNFYRVGNSLYFTDAAVSSKVEVVHYNRSYKVDKVYFSFDLTREDPSIAKQPSVTYHNNSGNRSITLDNGYRFAISVGDTGKFGYKNVADASEWVSSNPEVATVNSDGTLTAVSAGETTVSLNNAKGEAIYSYTVEVAELKVFYENSVTGERTEIKNGSTFTIPTSGSGKIVIEGYKPGAGKTTIWDVMDEESWNKGVGVSRNGTVTVTSPDTVDVALKGSKAPYLVGNYDFILFRFKLQAITHEIEEVRAEINGKPVEDKGSWTLNGSESIELKLYGKYKGAEEFVDLSRADYEIKNDDKMVVSIYDNGTYVEFSQPGEGDLTIKYGEGQKYTIHMKSTYVPIESMKLDLPETFPLHRFNYALGNGDNYQGLQQNILNAALKVTPGNASYIHNVQWSSSDETIGEWWKTYENGIIGHNAGTIKVTATVQDGDNLISASDDVTFYWQYPIEKLEARDDNLMIKVGEQVSLPIVYTPKQPSQALINWSQEGDGEVKVTRGVNSEYDWFSNTNYYVTGIKEGTVTITGTPVAAAKGTSPSVKFTIHVGAGGEKPVLPDTTSLVKTWKESIQQYYKGSKPSWKYGMEWNIIALKRAGIDMKVDKDAYLASVKAELADEYGDLTANGKPTDLERTALAMYALGLDPRNIEMDDGSKVDLIQWILDSDRISQGSNEVAFALLAIDANEANIPEGSKWNRDTLVKELLSFQADDGSFVLSKPASKTGSIDMTAMSLQALSRYTDREDVKAAVDKGLDYLKRNINMGDYGTVESNDQVIITLLMLGIDPSADDSGFTAWGANIFTATDKYRIENGGFAHTKGSAVNEMATQQTLLAVAAWERFAAGENDIYDMRDVIGDKEPNEPKEPSDEDKNAAAAVDALIDSIGEVTPDSGEAIQSARDAYDSLSATQKALVSKLDILTAAEEAYKQLKAEDKKSYVAVAVEKFTIGQGYLVEPVLVEIQPGKDTTAEVIDALSKANGLRYDNTGSLESSFYLKWILDEKGSLTANFPEIIRKYAEEQGIEITNERKRATLGEFDYSQQSGWMYTLNNDMPNVGMSDTKPENGDVVRIRFTTVMGDLCSGNNYVDYFVPNVNGDSLTWTLAEFNSSKNREELMGYENVREAYENAVAAISNIANTQATIDAAESVFKEAVANPGNSNDHEAKKEAEAVMNLIGQIGEVTLDSEKAIQEARNAYNALTEEQKGYVTNYGVLKQAEKTFAELLAQADADRAAADAVKKQIYALPSPDEITFDSREQVEAARADYEALTEAQKAYVDSDMLAKLKALEKALSQRQEQVEQVISAIKSLPETEVITLDDKEAIEKVRAAYNALADDMKLQIPKEILTILANKEARIKEIEAAQELNPEPTPDLKPIPHPGKGSETSSSANSVSSETRSVEKSVKTGDDTVVFPYVMLLIIAAGTGTVLMPHSRRRNTSNK